MESVDIRSAQFTIKDPSIVALVSGRTETSFLISSVSSDTKALVACANDTEFSGMYARLRVGSTYRLAIGAKQVRVTKIYDEDANHAAIEGEFSAAPVAAETYYGSLIERISIGHIIQDCPYGPVVPVAFSRQQYQSNRYRDGNREVLCLSAKDVPRSASGANLAVNEILVRGRLVRVFMVVEKAYTGAEATSGFAVTDSSFGAIAVVNTKTVGAREVTSFANAGSVAGDTLAASTAATYHHTIKLYQFGAVGGKGPVDADAMELAKYIIVLEILKDPGH